MKLSWRLLVSYLIVLGVTLGVMVLAFFAIARARPAPAVQTYDHLLRVALNTDLRSLLAQVNADVEQSGSDTLLQNQLLEVSDAFGVRVLLIDTQERLIIYDSSGVFSAGQTISVEYGEYDNPGQFRPGVLRTTYMSFGSLKNPTGDDWLFIAWQSDPPGPNPLALVFADQSGRQSLQDALGNFADDLLPLLIQAGAVGVIIATVVAGVISRTIARPLQSVALAAGGIAAGNYAERVPVSGPLEVRAVAESFNHMSAQVQQAQQAQQDFLANVSHDLKTPLTSIQGFSQAIMDGTASDPVSAARIIHEEAGRLNRMVVELTDLARLNAGRLSMNWKAVDIGILTATVAERLAIVAREKQITLKADVRSLPTIVGDGDRLAQVLTNLISNAIQYTSAGGNVWVRGSMVQNGVQIAVQDDGIGIAPDELPRIFERFYQVDKARGPQRGTGLGLAIVAEIVQAHGGRLNVSSEGVGKGSTFTLWLPSPQMSTILRKRDR
ncbi:MAG: HAMP domain-containing sensor histidine kinase [Chloroflexota bacterium]|nr:HAMP domain-containing sensor histidine kinase [Chloroflexota bacterium]